MSKRKDKTPTLADWEITLRIGSTVVIADSWWLSGKDGYTFHDHHGVAYMIPREQVQFIRRRSIPVASVDTYSEAAQ